MRSKNIVLNALIIFHTAIFMIALIVFPAFVISAEAQAIKYVAGATDDLVNIFIRSGATVGKSTVIIVEKHVIDYGDDFVRAAKSVGHDAVEIASKHSKQGLVLVNSQGRKAVQAIANYGDDALRACAMHGDNLASVMAKTKKIPAEVLKSHGKELMMIEKAVPRGVEITAEAIAQGGVRNAEKVISAMGKYGKKILDYIQDNPVLFGEMLLGFAVYKVVTDEKLFAEAVGGMVNLAGKGIDKAGEVAIEGIDKAIDPVNGGGASSMVRSAGLMVILLIIVLAILARLGFNMRKIFAMFKKPEKQAEENGVK